MDGGKELGISPMYFDFEANVVLDHLARLISLECFAPSLSGNEAEVALVHRIAHLLEDSGRTVVDWK